MAGSASNNVLARYIDGKDRNPERNGFSHNAQAYKTLKDVNFIRLRIVCPTLPLITRPLRYFTADWGADHRR
jgi:hypothetical protein